MLIASVSSPLVLTTMHILLMLHRGIQNKVNDLLVTVKWLIKTPELHRLFKSCDGDLIPDIKDPLGLNFVMIAAWWFFKIKNLCISPN